MTSRTKDQAEVVEFRRSQSDPVLHFNQADLLALTRTLARQAAQQDIRAMMAARRACQK